MSDIVKKCDLSKFSKRAPGSRKNLILGFSTVFFDEESEFSDQKFENFVNPVKKSIFVTSKQVEIGKIINRFLPESPKR